MARRKSRAPSRMRTVWRWPPRRRTTKKSPRSSFPPYAFGAFHVTGPDGFTLTGGRLRHVGSSEGLPFGTIPFPYLGFIVSLLVASGLCALGWLLIRHTRRLAKAARSDQDWQGTALLSKKDLPFLVVSGLIVLTFTGSAPPLHMWDSTWYVRTAVHLRELFTTHAYPIYRSPGYPLFIWFLRKLMGPGYGLILVQELLFFLTAFLLFKVVDYLTRGGRLAAWLTGLLYLLNPLNLFFSQFIQPESLWRDLMVVWAFSLVLVMRRNLWGVVLGGGCLGFLWLSRASALPSVLLCVVVGSVVAARRISLIKYLLTVGFVISLIYSPYYLYLRAVGTKSQSYFAALHHSLSFRVFERTLDESAPCFAGSRREVTGSFDWSIPWMKGAFRDPAQCHGSVGRGSLEEGRCLRELRIRSQLPALSPGAVGCAPTAGWGASCGVPP